MNDGDTVRITAGPYEGRTGRVIGRREKDGFIELSVEATDYAAATTGMFDPRYLKPKDAS